MLEMEVATYSVWRERFMRKRMMLFAAGTVIFVSAAQNTFAEEDGRYELISGHRRKKACELAGLETLKCEVKELTRDEAIIVMVESNLQRSVILPSEKAFAYKMRLEAMNRQGQRTDLTSRPVGEKLFSVDKMSRDVSDSSRQIHRYIRLTELKKRSASSNDEIPPAALTFTESPTCFCNSATSSNDEIPPAALTFTEFLFG